MRTPEWYDKKIREIRDEKRDLTKRKNSMDSQKQKARKEELRREKRAAKRGEKQDMKKMIEAEIEFMNRKK